jgi:hypothetical protein
MEAQLQKGQLRKCNGPLTHMELRLRYHLTVASMPRNIYTIYMGQESNALASAIQKVHARTVKLILMVLALVSAGFLKNIGNEGFYDKCFSSRDRGPGSPVHG